jgi:hypothetical protein
MRAPVLTHETVHRIRTEGLSDTYWERTLGVTRTCVQKARVGITWQTHPTPPDAAPRVMNNPGGRKGRAETSNLPQMSDVDRTLSQLLAKWPRVVSVEVV